MYKSAKAYQSITPNSNPILQKLWDEAAYKKHRLKIFVARSSLDNTPPITHPHLNERLKKQEMLRDQRNMIERDNHTLLVKMTNIIQTKGRIDHINNYQQRSLNTYPKRQEMLKVINENKRIAERIRCRKPNYSHTEWLRKWDESLKYTAIVSKYPRVDANSKKAPKSSTTTKSSKRKSSKATLKSEAAKIASAMTEKTSVERLALPKITL